MSKTKVIGWTLGVFDNCEFWNFDSFEEAQKAAEKVEPLVRDSLQKLLIESIAALELRWCKVAKLRQLAVEADYVFMVTHDKLSKMARESRRWTIEQKIACIADADRFWGEMQKIEFASFILEKDCHDHAEMVARLRDALAEEKLVCVYHFFNGYDLEEEGLDLKLVLSYLHYSLFNYRN